MLRAMPAKFHHHPMQSITEKEFLIMAHTLGIQAEYAKKSKLKRDKALPKNLEFYRNRFCAGENHHDMEYLKSLAEKGCMARGTVINNGQDTMWYVTTDGIAKFVDYYYQYIQSTP